MPRHWPVSRRYRFAPPMVSALIIRGTLRGTPDGYFPRVLSRVLLHRYHISCLELLQQLCAGRNTMAANALRAYSAQVPTRHSRGAHAVSTRYSLKAASALRAYSARVRPQRLRPRGSAQHYKRVRVIMNVCVRRTTPTVRAAHSQQGCVCLFVCVFAGSCVLV